MKLQFVNKTRYSILGFTLSWVVLTFPFSWNTLPFYSDFLEWISLKTVKEIANFLGFSHDFPAGMSSDSTATFGWFFLSVIVGILLALIITQKFRPKLERIDQFTALFLTYFLAVILIRYGFDKVFKLQFYQPEPNILFTPLGNLSKDIAFWSVVGSSYNYSLLTGLLEVLTGTLLLSYRFRRIGLLISIGIFSQIVLINFSFDISVKLLSSLLVFISIYLSKTSLKSLFDWLIHGKATPESNQQQSNHFRSKFIQFVVVSWIFYESLFLAISTGNFNDDKQLRPTYHGAYEVVKSGVKGFLTDKKRLFFHRDFYLILEDSNQIFTDFKISSISNQTNEMILHGKNNTRISVQFKSENSGLSELIWNKTDTIELKPIDWRKMPLLRDDFHVGVD
jgi:uncharacterized membrane protein YphA (DoxX/SURF4 family)